MPVESALQVSIATMAALGTLLLSIGQRDPVMPLFALLVSMTSVYLVDLRKRVWLNRKGSNAAAIASAAYCFWGLHEFGLAGWLLAVAQLMIFLQFILQYQPKSTSRYWMLSLLSLMQVAVGSALSFDLMFGLILPLYLLAATLTMILFFLHRESGTCSAAVAAGGATVQVHSAPSDSPTLQIQSGPRRRERDLTWGQVLGQLGLIAVVTLLVTSLTFIGVPRIGRNRWSDLTVNRSVTGVPELVELGDMGQIVESAEAVMRISFVDAATGAPYALSEEPLLRGRHFVSYRSLPDRLTNTSRGEWRQSMGRSLEVLKYSPAPRDAVLQQIVIEPQRNPLLFAMHPIHPAESGGALLYDHQQDQLLRREEMLGERFSFEVLTTGLHRGRQLPFVPSRETHQEAQAMYTSRAPVPMPQLDSETLEAIEGVEEGDQLSQARRLEGHLRYTGGFTYSLSLERHDRSLDPIEDFVANSRRGHCEYFATALTLMLRKVGIPARYVVGYKGGEWNGLGRFYQVRQLHAHAWVEAHLPPDQLPADLPGPPEIWKNGAWLILDPTPSVSGPTAVANGGFGLDTLRQLTDYARYLWSSYVVGMDATRQFDAIYAPLWEEIRDAVLKLLDPQTWRDGWASFKRGLATLATLEGWFSWRAGLVGMAISAVLIFAGRWIWSHSGRLARWFGWVGRRHGQEAFASVEFYHQLEALLAPRGLVRAPQQTQREFALAAGGTLADEPETQAVASLPLRIADAFYRVRFGRADLDKQETEAVEHALSELRAALAPPRTTRS